MKKFEGNPIHLEPQQLCGRFGGRHHWRPECLERTKEERIGRKISGNSSENGRLQLFRATVGTEFSPKPSEILWKVDGKEKMP